MVTVTGVIAGKNGITLFCADGTTKQLASDAWGTRAIIEAITPGLAEFGTSEIDLDKFTLTGAIAKLTGGLTKVEDHGGKTTVTHAGKVLDDTGALTRHIEDAAYGESAKGFKNFLTMFTAIRRSLTAKEVLSFMKEGDLPIADDGSIIGYKILNLKGVDAVDRYSGKVVQRVGSLVYMPGCKIDDSYRDVCSSNGLHVCSFKYIGDFRGDCIMLVKVKPGDVISVPRRENSKMRAAGYHVCARLSDATFAELRRGKALTDIPEGLAALERVIIGNHSPIIERVAVKMGSGDITIEPVIVKKVKTSKKKVRKIEKDRVRRRVDVASIKKTVRAVKAKISKSAADDMEYTEKLRRAQNLFDNGHSIRDIAKMLFMDRESLGKNLKRA